MAQSFCTQCSRRPCNPGRKWCEICYRSAMASQNQAPCSQGCGRIANPGKKWCQQCHQVSLGQSPGQNSPLKACSSNACPNSANQGFSLCQKCYTLQCKVTKPMKCNAGFCQQTTSGNKYCVTCLSAFRSKGLCTNGCGTPANPGQSWCQNCFLASQATAICSNNGCNNQANAGKGWCQACYKAQKVSVIVSLKPMLLTQNQNIDQQFKAGMAKKQYAFNVVGVLSAWNTQQHAKYESYKKTLSQANERRWWHGSDLKCDLMKNQVCCSDLTCCICSILKSSFLLSKSQSKTGWGRFGKGIYFAPDAAKSHDYTHTSVGYRALVLTRVAVGKCAVFQQDQPTLTAPPAGYDSVLGEVGTHLNYPECIIYNESACCPAYVVFYQ